LALAGITSCTLAVAENGIGPSTDTHHVPGIQPADVEALLEKGSKVIVALREVVWVLFAGGSSVFL
jgi:hypothetical protein